MVNNNKDDLKVKGEEILKYAKNQGFSIFYSKEFDHYDYDIFEWDSSRDWKEFFVMAKNETVKIVVANINILDSSNEDRIRTVQSTMEEEGQEDEELDFAKYNGKVASYQFLWVKDGIKYSLSEMTEWYSEYRQMGSELKSGTRLSHSGIGYSSSGMD